MKKLSEYMKKNSVHYAIIATICVLLTTGLCLAFYNAKTVDGFEMLFIGLSYIFAVCLVFFLYAWLAWLVSGKKICLFKSKKSGVLALLKYFVIMLTLVAVLSFAMGASWKLSAVFLYTYMFLGFSIPTIALGTTGLVFLYRNKG